MTIDNPLGADELSALSASLAKENVGATYSYLAQHGYKYAMWAKGVALGNTVTGTAALGFMTHTSALSSEVVDEIKLEMAKAYLKELVRHSKAAEGYAVTDVTAIEVWKFHEKVFNDKGLSVDAWTLNSPFAIIQKTYGNETLEAVWQSLRDTGGEGPPAIEKSIGLLTWVLNVDNGSFQNMEGLFWLNQLTKSVTAMTSVAAAKLATDSYGSAEIAGSLIKKELASWLSDVSGAPVERAIADSAIASILTLGGYFREDILTLLGRTTDVIALPNDFEERIARGLYKLATAPNEFISTAMLSAMVALRAPGYDPLTVDLNNDGHMSAPRAAGAYFDMAHDGFAESSGWVQAGDALVVRDLNHNGSIDSGAELFGDQTRLATGALAANGYTALADLDSNHDGVFSAQDAAWGEVMLWKDNGDGVTQPGEVVALTEEGVAALKLSYSTVNALDAAGNILAQTNSTGAALEDGTSVATGTFLLASDPTDTVPLEYLPLNDSIAALPELAGSGLTYDLSQAMARDSVLQAMVASVASSTDYAALPAQFEHLLLRWTHADAVPLGSRGLTMNAQHLAVLESFYGQGFINTTDGFANAYPRNPSPTATLPMCALAFRTLPRAGDGCPRTCRFKWRHKPECSPFRAFGAAGWLPKVRGLLL